MKDESAQRDGSVYRLPPASGLTFSPNPNFQLTTIGGLPYALLVSTFPLQQSANDAMPFVGVSSGLKTLEDAVLGLDEDGERCEREDPWWQRGSGGEGRR